MYGAFLIIGSFIFGLIRAYAPKLLFMSIFGTIAGASSSQHRAVVLILLVHSGYLLRTCPSLPI
jgi:Na+/serine symporter